MESRNVSRRNLHLMAIFVRQAQHYSRLSAITEHPFLTSYFDPRNPASSWRLPLLPARNKEGRSAERPPLYLFLYLAFSSTFLFTFLGCFCSSFSLGPTLFHHL